MENPIPAGVVIDARYRIESLVAEGGMGAIYRAVDILDQNRPVVLKVLEPQIAGDVESRARFIREGGIVSSVHSDRISQLIGSGLWRNSVPYMAMEYVEGKTLSSLLKSNGTLTSDDSIKIAIQICRAMSQLHAQDIAHRDLKPSSIMILDSDDVSQPPPVKVLDFGLARLVSHPGNRQQTVTETGMIVGSAFYMSPEQCLGMRIDTRCDIYSVGCILYEMLLGKPPFTARNPIELLHSHINLPAVAPSLCAPHPLPPALDELLERALAKSADERYQSMSELSADLQSILDGLPLSPKPKRGKNNFIALTVNHKVSTRNLRKWRRSEVWFLCALIAAPIICFLGITRPDETPLRMIGRFRQEMKGLSDRDAVDFWCVRIANRKLRNEPAEIFRVSNDLSQKYINKKQFKAALRVMTSAAQVILQHCDTRPDLVALIDCRLAVINNLQGDSETAQKLYREALKYCPASQPHIQLLALLGLAECQRFDEAPQTYRKILDRQQEFQLSPLEIVIIQRKLTNLLSMDGNDLAAETLLKSYLDNRQTVLDTAVKQQYQAAALDLAEVEIRAGKYEQACEQTNNILQETSLAGNMRVRALSLKAHSKELQGDLAQAESLYLEAFKTEVQGKSHEAEFDKVEICLGLRRIYEMHGNSQKATEYRKAAYELSVKNGDFAGMSESGRDNHELDVPDQKKKKDEKNPKQKSRWYITGESDGSTEMGEDETQELFEEHFASSRRMARTKAFLSLEFKTMAGSHYKKVSTN